MKLLSMMSGSPVRGRSGLSLMLSTVMLSLLLMWSLGLARASLSDVPATLLSLVSLASSFGFSCLFFPPILLS